MTPDAEQAAAILKAAHDQRQSLASQAQAQIGDVAALTSFLLRQGERSDAGVWLDRLENGVKAHANNDPRAIALLIELRTTHGTLKQCEPWIGRLEAIDRDPIRPLIARGPLPGGTGTDERTRIARAIGDLYLAINFLQGAERWYRIAVREDKQQFPILAHTLMRQGRAREAIALCQTATEFDSTSRPAAARKSLDAISTTSGWAKIARPEKKATNKHAKRRH
ncbi:MAG TPA: hypothetical protein VFB96_22685 [Pirellulaceae bacterium]|nr:hypothetical protein [Pirellulaceae bacterium]